MTERLLRVPNVGGVEGPASGPEFMPHANVTADIVDRAVSETFKEANLSASVARVMRGLMAGDASSPVAKSYFHGMASGTNNLSRLGVSRRVLEIPYVISDEQVAALSDYAPDFQLRLGQREMHDHPMAAACRTIDRAIVSAREPPGVEVSHIGGSVVPLVMSGRLGRGHHACMPLADRKDQARQVLLNLRMRKISSDLSRPAAVREAALGYLAKDMRFVCSKRVQDCPLQTPVLTSVHVYDIPMEDWAGIMDNKGAQMVEGCVLFPRDIFSRSSGEMTVAGARYELNANSDSFRMGFIGSPSWWYEHKLSDYLKYGVDQILCVGGATYSYKITERRGDTLFFRILRVSNAAMPYRVQHYKVPGVPMVRVNGFSIVGDGKSSSHGSRRSYMFPATLWEDMLQHAKEMVERGVLSHEKLFGYYRTVAPRQSINAVVVAGGVTVEDLNHLVPLVVHVALFAMLEVRKTKVEAASFTDEIMRTRVRSQEHTLYKLVAAFGTSLHAACKLTCAPLKIIANAVDAKAIASLSDYDWDFQPVIQEVSARVLLPNCFPLSGQTGQAIADFSGFYAEAAPFDLIQSVGANPRLARFAIDNLGSALPDSVKNDLEKKASSAACIEVESAPDGGTRASTVEDHGTAFTADVSEEEVKRRKDSIREAIAESDLEAKKSEAACSDHYRELMVGGAPSKSKLLSRKEAFFNPEFWKITGGVIESSFSGVPVAGFQHAVIFVPRPEGGTRLVSVAEEEFKGMSMGEYVERKHYKLVDSQFSGWGYTNDSLMIHNGPAVERALLAALNKPMNFLIVLKQGPPGCGKTTSIVSTAKPVDVILVPVRKAVAELKGRLKDSEGFSEDVLRRVRTLDSYLVNYNKNTAMRTLSSVRLLADEAFMAREGRWLAAAALLGVDVVEAFGDAKQIPHVPRVECPKSYVSLQSQREDTTYVSHRCPPQLVACWGKVYDWKVRSASKIVGDVRHVASTSGMEIPKGCVMMGMYQADKALLRQKYGASGAKIQIMTVHESEGNTYEHVWLHRFDMRRRTDGFSLYDKEPYALVAMSRSQKSFVYVAPDLGDKVSEWIKLGKDSRRIEAAADVKTAGKNMEYL